MNHLLLLAMGLSLAGSALTLIRHILFKRKLFQLKQEMMMHKKEHGFDEKLWTLFHTRTNNMLRFWQ